MIGNVSWRGGCANGACVEVAFDGGRVLVRDGKLGQESPVIEFTPSGWRGFTTAAVEWDRRNVLNISDVAMQAPATEYVCLLAYDSLRHLHFTWEEWDEFVKGVQAGKFDLEVKT